MMPIMNKFEYKFKYKWNDTIKCCVLAVPQYPHNNKSKLTGEMWPCLLQVTCVFYDESESSILRNLCISMTCSPTSASSSPIWHPPTGHAHSSGRSASVIPLM